MYVKTFNTLDKIINKSSSFDEGWGFINIKGSFDNEIISLIKELQDQVYIIKNILSIELDEEHVNAKDIDTYGQYDNWGININKQAKVTEEGFNVQYFYSKEKFLIWANKVNVFDAEYIINKSDKLKIVVNKLTNSFGGESFVVVNNINDEFNERLYNLPSEKEISKFVHCINEKSRTINPQNNFIITSCANNEYTKPFLKNAALVLVASIVNEFYSQDKIILRGIKRVQLKLIDSETNITLKQLHKLAEVVSWIYEDKQETRQKLFIDRVTLDINYDLPLIPELIRIIDSVFQQAKERYNFVIIDRQENYLKEVRDLLKDIKSQSDLYSHKIRSLLSNLLRDVLAGFLLIGFTLLPKVTALSEKVKLGTFFELLFKALALYFIISAIIQIVVDVTDMIISKKEMLYWKNISRNYIPEQEFNTRIKESLKSRISSVCIFYSILLLCYIGIAILCWNYPIILSQYLLLK